MLSDQGKLAFIGSITIADCAGTLPWTPEHLASEIFPYDKHLTPSDVSAIMSELVQLELIKPYADCDGGLPYGLIPNFHRHQELKNPGISRSPEPPDGWPPEYYFKLTDGQKRTLKRWSRKVSGTVWGVERGNRKYITQPNTSCCREDHPVENGQPVENSQPALSEMFSEWWQAYPKKIRPQVSKNLWLELSPTPELFGAMMEALEEQVISKEWGNPRHIPRPDTWLRDRMWEKDKGRNERKGIC